MLLFVLPVVAGLATRNKAKNAVSSQPSAVVPGSVAGEATPAAHSISRSLGRPGFYFRVWGRAPAGTTGTSLSYGTSSDDRNLLGSPALRWHAYLPYSTAALPAPGCQYCCQPCGQQRMRGDGYGTAAEAAATGGQRWAACTRLRITWSCPTRARSGGRSGTLTVTRGQTDSPADLGRST